MTATRKILELNAFDMREAAGLDPETADLVARRRRVFGPASMLFYARPLNLVRGEGVWLIGADGTRYLDAYNNVASVGHCHPRVVAAVSRQMATLNTHSRYLSEIVYTYAERLLATLPRELSNIVLTCTGSESVDLSLRIARAVTGGTGFIVTENAYHGNTLAVTEISPSSASAEPRNPHVFLVPAPDTYRTGSEEVGPLFAANIRKAISAMKRKKIRFAGLVADSIFSSDGIYPGEPGFMAEAIADVRKEGGLFIADEVQPGFARTGEKMWGFERHGLVPDMVVMGKPMGNGYPIAGVAVKPDLLETFGKTAGYFNTFGGNPVAAAAGLAVLETLEAENSAAERARDRRLSLGGARSRRPALQPSRRRAGKGALHRRRARARPQVEEAGQGRRNQRRGNAPRPQYPGRHCRPLRQHSQDPPAALLCAGPCRPSRQGAFRLACDSLLIAGDESAPPRLPLSAAPDAVLE